MVNPAFAPSSPPSPGSPSCNSASLMTSRPFLSRSSSTTSEVIKYDWAMPRREDRGEVRRGEESTIKCLIPGEELKVVVGGLAAILTD